MNRRSDQAIATARQDEREGGREEPIRDGHINYHHYYGPVNMNHISQAYNPNFGPNHGYLNQNMYPISPPAPGYGLAAGGHTQLMAGPDVLSLLNPVIDASHTRNMKRSPPNSQCLPGTRKGVIRDIQTWADSDDLDANPHIMWIYGYAGCGKSAIAHAIAKHYAHEGRLAACFVFFRGSGDRSTVARFATTIASQVAAAIPETKPFIRSAVEGNAGLLSPDTASLSDQFEHLVYHPIHAIAQQLSVPVIIVLDGADECQDHDEISALIEDTLQFFGRNPRIPLRVLITSRVEDHLHQVLHSSDQVRLLNLVERTSDDDIAAALDVAIADAKRGRLLACDENWPGWWDRHRLVEHIAGSFLFMTIIVKKLFDRHTTDGLTPMERLPLVLKMEANFDDLYRKILTPWQTLPHFHAVISTIALAFEPLSVVQLAQILSIKTINVVNVLINLQSVLQLPGDDRTPVTLWHTSLRDFLRTEKRSGPLCAKTECHLCLAYWGFCAGFPSEGCEDLSTLYADKFALRHLQEYLTLVNSPVPDDILRQLTGPIFKSGQTALEASSHARKWTIVHGLAKAGADPDLRFREPTVGVICALHAACYHEVLDLVYLLLDKGANPNVVSPNTGLGFNDGTPLAFAALKGDVKLATRLLECGADPNLQGGYWGTALQAACAKGSLEIVELLLEHGADLNLGGGPWNCVPLHACASAGHEDCARALLMRNADPNPQDNDGHTPLHDACSEGLTSVVECLLEFKADASIKNNDGRTALQVAHWQGQHDVVEVFRRHGTVRA